MKVILSKEEFVKYMEDYREEADAISRLYHEFGIDMIDRPWYKSSQNFEDLLTKVMHDEKDRLFGTWISWWCWETDFGRNTEMTQLFETEDTEKVYKDIRTAEDLYDYLVERINGRDDIK